MYRQQFSIVVMIIVLAVSMISCGRHRKSPTPRPPTSTPTLIPISKLCLDPEVNSIDFGKVEVGVSEAQLIIIENCSSNTMHISMIFAGIWNAPHEKHFDALDGESILNAELSGWGKCHFRVWFNPKEEGTFQTELHIVTNADDDDKVIQISGIGTTPRNIHMSQKPLASPPGIPACTDLRGTYE